MNTPENDTKPRRGRQQRPLAVGTIALLVAYPTCLLRREQEDLG